jgi:hypothetical protein
MKINLKIFKHKSPLQKLWEGIKGKFARKEGTPKTLLQRALIFSLLVIVIGLIVLSGLKLFVAGFVNGRPISRIWLDRELERRVGQRLMDAEIGKILVMQEAKKKGIKVTTADVKQRGDVFKSEVEKQGSTFEDFLNFQGMTQSEFEDEIRLQIMVEKLLGEKVTVSDDEAKAYFEGNKTYFAEDATFEGSKELAKEAVFQQKVSEMYQSWLEELRGKAKIQYLLKF